MANIRKSFLFPDNQAACGGYFIVLYVIKMFSTFFQVLLQKQNNRTPVQKEVSDGTTI